MTRPRRPDPPPLRTDDRLVAAVGTVAWAIALVVLLIVDLPEDARWWLWVCVVGVATGIFGYWYLPRLHRARAAALERRALREGQGRAVPAAPPGATEASRAAAHRAPEDRA
ncbi:DUF2530 domain-containing protein [Thermomonospora sp. CIF 1]|uniref:DUF2530 domain-containing protein n=1 Tax=Thermomonospora sp. CIF 1 TaxID=1916083 RepID=UPI000ABE4B97|nr:DUF2530 domain-containing protein [Thermomonospora sp. CIF 1]PKK15813.1 MAG: DUF2530 domain-containing protein [Thermomonospora sp. CIF 1]